MILTDPIWSVLYAESKLWLMLISFAYGCFKAFTWVKGIRTHDFKTLNESMVQLKEVVSHQTDRMQHDLSVQTGAIVGELRELRADLRGLRSIAVEPMPRMRLAKAAKRKKSS